MSIQPSYAEAILQGSKLVEFRKRPIAGDVSHVLVYATKPIGGIIGAFAIAGQKTASPQKLWEAFHEIAGIDLDSFEAYYGTLDEGTGIEVGEVLVAPHAFSLLETLGLTRAPQSFQFVDSEKARILMNSMCSTVLPRRHHSYPWVRQLGLDTHAD